MTGLLLCLLHVSGAQASKLRSWLDSSVTLMEGSQPSSRFGHGFAAAEDGKIYVFGGYGAQGTKRGSASVMTVLRRFAAYTKTARWWSILGGQVTYINNVTDKNNTAKNKF